MAEKNYTLFGGGGDTVGTLLAQILQEMNQPVRGGTSTQPKTQAPPSASPIGKPTAQGGMPTQTTGVDISRAPIPKGFRTTSVAPSGSPGGSGAMQGGGGTASFMAGQGGGTQTGGGTASFFAGQGPSSDVGDLGGLGGGEGEETSPDLTGYGNIISSVGDLVTDTVDMFSMDETEKLQREQRERIEIGNDILRNWKAVYETYMLPEEAATKDYAYQQLGKHSENYEYASTALKGLIEGSAGVYGGVDDYEQMWQDIDNDLAALESDEPATWLESFQDHYENDTVGALQKEVTNQVLKYAFDQMGLNISDGLRGFMAGELAKWGNAMIGATRDQGGMISFNRGGTNGTV